MNKAPKIQATVSIMNQSKSSNSNLNTITSYSEQIFSEDLSEGSLDADLMMQEKFEIKKQILKQREG
jgi:hypothetical protein